MALTTLQILVKARKLIEKPAQWTRGADARNKDGRSVPYDSQYAKCFCPSGAIGRVANINGHGGWVEAAAILNKESGGNFVEYNDAPRRTHAQILKLFDRAIAKLAPSQRKSAPRATPKSSKARG